MSQCASDLDGGRATGRFINAQRALAEEAASAAMTKLSETARRIGAATKVRLEIVDFADAADISATSPGGSIYQLSVNPTPMWSGRRN
jgi:hypothetical protein